MSPLVTVVLPGLLMGAAIFLGRRELGLYRTRDSRESDVFVYSRGRLVRRLTGCVLIGMMAITFFCLGVFPPRSPQALATYTGLLLAELGALFPIPIWDLIETARTARPGRGQSFKEEARRTAQALRDLEARRRQNEKS